MSGYQTMLLSEVIENRRSVRWYADRVISDHILHDLLKAAASAPSPHNRQPWRFAVLATPAAKRHLAEVMGDKLRQDRLRDGDAQEDIDADVARSILRISGAPAVILAALSMAEMDRYDDPERNQAEYMMAVQATSAAVQNLLLAAHGNGLGATWMCAPLFCSTRVREALELPTDWQPQALVTLGYPAKSGRVRSRKHSDEFVRWITRPPDI